MSPSPSRRPILAALFALLSGVVLHGCAGYPTPYPVSRLRVDARDDAGKALVHYLSQAGADVAVCEPGTPEYALQAMEPRQALDLVKGVKKGTVAASVWRECVRRYLPQAPPTIAAVLVDRLVFAIGELAEDAPSPRRNELLSAFESALEARPRTPPLSDAHLERLEGALRATRARHTDDAALSALVVSAQLERGIFEGRPVDAAMIADTGDDALLQKMRERLPDADARRLATERLVDIRIAASVDPAVRHDLSVRARVLETGRNAVVFAESSVDHAFFDGPPPDFVVVARQNPQSRTVQLGAIRQGEESIVPTLDFRAGLRFAVEGAAPALSLCAPPEALEVRRCVDARDLALPSPAARLDAEGIVHFAEALTVDALIELAAEHDRVTLPLRGAERALFVMQPTLVLARPDPLEYGDGVDVVVRMRARGRLVIVDAQAASGGHRATAVLDRTTAGGYRIQTVGRPGRAGAPGTRGHAGTSGLNGMSASCPSRSGTSGGRGGNGGAGGPGHPGGPGGDGGDIEVVIECSSAECDALRAVASTMVRSIGGPGGPGGTGGEGGPGGHGGRGGSSAYCSGSGSYGQPGYRAGGSVPGGSNGSDGMNGSRGINGPHGRDGQPGRVTMRTVEPPATSGAALVPGAG